MPGRHVALIRGINVGRAKRVAMADLRTLCADLGYRDVATLLNSGNVVFTVPGRADSGAGARIERGMETRLGVSARVMTLTAEELAAIVEKNPLGEVARDPSRMLVAVLADSAQSARLAPLARQDWGREALALGPRAAYLWCGDGILASRLWEAVNRALGDGATTRNWNTMTKLHALAGAAPKPAQDARRAPKKRRPAPPARSSRRKRPGPPGRRFALSRRGNLP